MVIIITIYILFIINLVSMFRYCHYNCYCYDNYCCSKIPTWQPALTTPPYTTSVRMTLAGMLTPCFNSNSLSSSTVTPAPTVTRFRPFTYDIHIKGFVTWGASLSIFILANDEFQCIPSAKSNRSMHFKKLDVFFKSK